MGIILFSLSGIIWIGFLVPDQNRLILLSEKIQTKEGKLPGKFLKVLHRWYFWGVIATILPLITVLVMTLKPNLW